MINKNKIKRSISFYLILLMASLSLTIGCQPKIAQLNQDCQILVHSAGETCIPNQWEKLVTLDGTSLENAIALGLIPTGAVTSNLSNHLEDKLTQVKDVGRQGEPSLEGILTLKPELIIGIDAYQNIYSRLQQIAPSVLFAFEHSGKWKEVFLNTSQALGKKETGDKILAEYYARLAEFKTQMGGRLDKIAISVIRIYPEQISLYLQDSFPGVILQDAGLNRPPSQSVDAQEAMKLAKNPIQMFISPELLNLADGDVIFIWTAENETESNQNAKARLLELQNNPLWQKLKAVKTERVYQVPNYWIGSGPIAANLVIDDLFKYLVTKQEDKSI